MHFPLSLRLAFLVGACLGGSSCEKMQEAQARSGELKERSESLIQEVADLEPKVQAIRSTLPGTLHTVQAAAFQADKLDKDFQEQEAALRAAVQKYAATEEALKALQAELAAMRSAARP